MVKKSDGIFLHPNNNKIIKTLSTKSRQTENMTHILCSVEPTPGLRINFTGRAGDIDRLDITRLGVFPHCTGRVLWWGWGRKDLR